MNWFIEKKHEGMRIHEYLQVVKKISRRIITAIKFDGGKIMVNDDLKTVRTRLAFGDHLSIQMPPEKKGKLMKPENIPLSIIYEDQDIMIVNKHHSMPTTPSPLNPFGSVANGLLAYYEENEIPYTVHAVTRLDRDTSGLLLIAKHRYSHSLLAASQKKGKITRKYKAVVEGHVKTEKGRINARIGRKKGSIIERMVTNDGKHAVTYYQVADHRQSHSLLNIQLETGRTHQIRVHFSSIGHPLAGDDLYGGSMREIKRQALHCDVLYFEHPLTKKRLTFHLPLPPDMLQLLSNHV